MKMEINHTETNRGNPSVITEGFSYRKTNVLKNEDIVYRCSAVKDCKFAKTRGQADARSSPQ